MPGIFENVIQTDEIFFKYAKGKSQMTGKEFHTYNEILFFMGGDAEFISEKGKQNLTPYTTVIIPKETFHQFIISGDENNYTRCVFNFKSVSQLDELIETKINKIMLIRNNKLNELFEQLMTIETIDHTQLEKNILLKAKFAEILVAIKPEAYVPSKQSSSFDQKVHDAISYINKNLDKPLTLPDIACSVNISESYLSHIFKKEMHISVHKYILEKRLILAHIKIKNSTPPLQAAYESGFNDYSGFYTQFKKMFGVSPSKLNSK